MLHLSSLRACTLVGGLWASSVFAANEYPWCSGNIPQAMPPLRSPATLTSTPVEEKQGADFNAVKFEEFARRGIQTGGSGLRPPNLLAGRAPAALGRSAASGSVGGDSFLPDVPPYRHSSFGVKGLGGFSADALAVQPGVLDPIQLSPDAHRFFLSLKSRFENDHFGALRHGPLMQSLASLPIEQQKRIVELAYKEPAVDSFAMLAQGANGSLERTARLTRAFTLEVALDQPIVQALFGVRLDQASNEMLLRLSDRKDVLSLGNHLDRVNFAARNKGWLKGRETVQIIAAGEAVQPGSLGEVPPGLPVRVVDAGDGKWCKRPTTTSDYRLDPERKTIGQNWDPIAFSDVAMLLFRKPGSGIAGISICTAIRISPNHLLTAAHCLATRSVDGKWVKRTFDGIAWEGVALLPSSSTGDQKPSECFEAPASCGFHVSRLGGRSAFPDDISWVGELPSPDIAMLQVDFPADAGVASTAAVGKEPALRQLTLAGFGLTNAGGQTYSGYLQVGWQRQTPRIDRGVLIWSLDLGGGFAGACSGDSGGAVFDGSVASKSDVRRLVGVISFGYGMSTESGIERCLKMTTGGATEVSKHAKWICRESAGTALGCSP
ncbi:S1 family peptidase [Aquincola tertiaricarbonis]|uniref:S1 family peptidase n=1 Tax=Aquincola tertiaricarbonis TaxID=391953 RepID=A0ABY4S0Y0_AQUTE|nr:trypsin-like serine protease [Aquincola tertiaricarbonis]URI07043.1 S1 family peptidase [Aquincola tertiaricarbonis]